MKMITTRRKKFRDTYYFMTLHMRLFGRLVEISFQLKLLEATVSLASFFHQKDDLLCILMSLSKLYMIGIYSEFDTAVILKVNRSMK